MKKRYIITFFAIIMAIAYFDLLDSCKKFDLILSDMLKLHADIKTEIDYASRKENAILKTTNPKIPKIQKYNHP